MDHTGVLDVVAGAMARDARVLAALFALSVFVVIFVSGAWVARVGLPRLVSVAVRVDERAANASCRDSSSTTAQLEASADARDRDDYRLETDEIFPLTTGERGEPRRRARLHREFRIDARARRAGVFHETWCAGHARQDRRGGVRWEALYVDGVVVKLCPSQGEREIFTK